MAEVLLEHRAAMPALAARVIGVPLCITQEKLEVLLHVLGPRIGLAGVVTVDPALLAAEARATEPHAGGDGIAVIPIMGTIVQRARGLAAQSGLAGVEAIRAQLRDALVDPRIGGILLHVDSDGGEVAGLADMALELRAADATKPVHAFIDEHAYSAAYWLAASASHVSIASTGGTGSIGAVAVHVDVTAADAMAGRKITIIRSAELKANVNAHEPLSDAGQARLEALVGKYARTFATSIAAHRPVAVDDVLALKAGTVDADDALTLKLVDTIGTFDSAVAGLRDEMTKRARKPAGGRPMTTGTQDDSKVVTHEEFEKRRAEAATAGAADERKRIAAIRETGKLAAMTGRLTAEKLDALVDELIEKGANADEARAAFVNATASAGPAIDPTHAPSTAATAAMTPLNVKQIYADRNAAIDEANAKRARPVRIGVG